MSLDTIAQVNISLQTLTATGIGFKIPIIVGANAPWGAANSRYMLFNSQSEVTDPGAGAFQTTDPEAIAAENYFKQNPKVPSLIVGWWDQGNESITESLDAIKNVNNTFYNVSVVDHTEPNLQIDVSDWVAANEKLYWFSADDADILDGNVNNDLFSTLQANSYQRSIGLWHQDADTLFPETAFAGKGTPKAVGSLQWRYQGPIVGIEPSNDFLNATQQSVIANKYGNFYIRESGLPFISGETGVTFDGNQIEVIRMRDWIKNEMQIRILNAQFANDNIPLNDPGLKLLGGIVEGVLIDGQDQGWINAYTITVPTLADLTNANIANGIVDAISFQAQVTIGVKTVIINGVITTSNLP